MTLLKNTARPEKRDTFVINGSKGRDVLGNHNIVTLPVGRDRKIQTALRSNQIAGFVTMPSEKK